MSEVRVRPDQRPKFKLRHYPAAPNLASRGHFGYARLRPAEVISRAARRLASVVVWMAIAVPVSPRLLP